MSEQLPRSPLETLVLRTPAIQVRAFLLASSVIRTTLAQREESTLILPLRGAMPMFWAADGSSIVEPPSNPTGQNVEIPIGTYHYVGVDGKSRVASPERGRKKRLIYEALDDTQKAKQSITQITLLDEVQRGGTIVPLAEHTVSYAKDRGIATPIFLLATQDSRAKTIYEEKTAGYKQLAANVGGDVVTSVIPMPLIACDRDNLLDKVVFEGKAPVTHEPLNAFRVERNERAEQIFRNLGSMIRNHEVATDESFIQATVESQGPINVKVANHLEGWMSQVLTGHTNF
jgi:hypothetical protein